MTYFEVHDMIEGKSKTYLSRELDFFLFDTHIYKLGVTLCIVILRSQACDGV